MGTKAMTRNRSCTQSTVVIQSADCLADRMWGELYSHLGHRTGTCKSALTESDRIFFVSG